MKIYVKKWYSEKHKKEYTALCIKRGYKERTVTFDRLIIAEFLGCRIADLNDLDVGEHYGGKEI